MGDHELVPRVPVSHHWVVSDEWDRSLINQVVCRLKLFSTFLRKFGMLDAQDTPVVDTCSNDVSFM